MKFRLSLCLLLATITLYGQSIPQNVAKLKRTIEKTQGIERALSLFELAKIYSVSDIDSTKLILDEALGICRSLKNDTTYILVATGMQEPLGQVGATDLALKYAMSARALKSPDAMRPKFQNLVYVAFYFANYWYATRYDSSIYYGLLTVAIAPDSLARADRMILVGAAYNKIGDNIKALEYYSGAQALLDNLPYFREEYCYLYNQFGMLYFDEGDMQKSEEFYLKSIDITHQTGMYPKVNPLNNIAALYDLLGDYDKALKYLDTAATVPTEDPFQTALNVRIRGKVLTHAGKPKQGIEETLKSIKLFGKLTDNYSVARLHLQLAEPYRILGDYRTAEKEALTALDWDRKNGYGEITKESYHELSRIYADTRQYGKAFEYQNRYLGILDSLNSTERRNKFKQLEKSYEFAAQERMRLDLQRKNELYLAQAKADRTVLLYLVFGTIVLTGAVIIAVVAYRRMRLQNVTLNDQNKKIEDQTQQLQEAAKMKSRFFANVSHELRTPVTLLNGMLELMHEDSSNGNNKKLSIALGSSRRLQGMLDEVLDLSRVESKHWKLSPKRREILPLLNRVVLAFESFLVKKNIRFEYNADALRGLVINIDEDKFEKIINNLIYNSIKFNRESGWIRVTGLRTERAVIIKVEDSGVGIPENELEFVFDRFYQSESTEKLSSRGIGIGLSLVREFTELHGGSVAVTSKVNEGSCFTVQFPTDSTSELIADDVEDTAVLPQINFKSFSRKPDVLIVEDNEEMRFYLKEILGTDVSISEAPNGNEALKRLASHIPDLIISDVMMPEMDGVEFLTHLKGSSAWRGIPVVMLTARASEEDLLRGLSLGVDDYIVKPFNASELKIRIHNLLANQEIRKQWMHKSPDVDDIMPVTGPGEDELFMEKVRTFVEQNAANAFLGNGDLCDHLAMSERQLYRKAATLTGMTPGQLIKEIRMKIAYRLLLQRSVVKVADLAKKVGFESPSYFSKQFQERFGKRPSEFL